MKNYQKISSNGYSFTLNELYEAIGKIIKNNPKTKNFDVILKNKFENISFSTIKVDEWNTCINLLK